eukprot:806892-Rhodomonas_salina.4
MHQYRTSRSKRIGRQSLTLEGADATCLLLDAQRKLAEDWDARAILFDLPHTTARTKSDSHAERRAARSRIHTRRKGAAPGCRLTCSTTLGAH